MLYVLVVWFLLLLGSNVENNTLLMGLYAYGTSKVERSSLSSRCCRTNPSGAKQRNKQTNQESFAQNEGIFGDTNTTETEIEAERRSNITRKTCRYYTYI